MLATHYALLLLLLLLRLATATITTIPITIVLIIVRRGIRLRLPNGKWIDLISRSIGYTMARGEPWIDLRCRSFGTIQISI